MGSFRETALDLVASQTPPFGGFWPFARTDAPSQPRPEGSIARQSENQH